MALFTLGMRATLTALLESLVEGSMIAAGGTRRGVASRGGRHGRPRDRRRAGRSGPWRQALRRAAPGRALGLVVRPGARARVKPPPLGRRRRGPARPWPHGGRPRSAGPRPLRRAGGGLRPRHCRRRPRGAGGRPRPRPSDPGRPVVGGNVVLELAWRQPETARGVACVDGGIIELAEWFP